VSRIPVSPVFLFSAALLLIPGAREAQALSYVESSQGLIPPSLEGGKTEVEFADVNADGHPDLVSIGDHGSPYVNTDQHGIMVWFGDGLGGWSVFMHGSFGYGGIALGDLNDDGHMDAAYGMHHDYSGTDLGDQLLEAALGDGSGRAWTPWDDGLATAGEDWGMFDTDLADFDVDGDLDIVSKSFGCCAGVHVYENQGDGTWTHFFGFLGGNAGNGIQAGDINADGYPDFAVAHASGTVYLRDPEGTFTLADANLPGSSRTGIALADIDRDGDLDLAFRSSDASLQVWRWNPDGVWTNASAGLPTSGIAAAQLADMNGDGWCDVLGLGNGVLTVWLGDGGSIWTLAWTTTLPAPGTFQAFRAGGDVDHNGLPDVAVITEQGSWPSYQNRFRVFRETSIAGHDAVRFESPLGGETFMAGSTRCIHWAAAREAPGEASVDLDLSTTGPQGPWTPLAAGIPDNGRFQWKAGMMPSTDAAHLRIRLHTPRGTVESVTPAPFSIIGSDPTAVGPGLGWLPSDPPSPRDAAPSCSPEIPAGVFRIMPNPATGAVRWSAVQPGRITITDVNGRVVRRLEGGSDGWDGLDAQGVRVADGVYYVATDRGQARVLKLSTRTR